jgi:Phosphopantetheine attachment site
MRDESSGAKQIVIYSLSTTGVEDGDLLVHARRSAPDYLVPDRAVLADSWSLKPNGKIDRSERPLPATVGKPGAKPPRNDQEKMLCDLFASVLNLPQIGGDDNSFRLARDSLLAVRPLNRVLAKFGVTAGHASLSEAPTVSDLALLLMKAEPARPKVRRMRKVTI